MAVKKDAPTVLCLFVKAPVAGRVKTRLCPPLRPSEAADLAAAFYADTLEAAVACRWARVVVAVAGDPARLEPPPPGVPIWPQGPGDLGRRMERVLSRIIREGGGAIALGTDSPGLPRARLAAGRRLLRRNDAVVGPCEDGGFYLLGLRRCPRGLLEGLPWSAATTRERLVGRLRSAGLRVALVQPWFDVDRAADLERLNRLLTGGRIRASRTARLLERLGAGGGGS